MKVLWFEVTEPAAYKSEGAPISGWQDSLERIVRTIPNIELTITFMSEKYSEEKVVGGVRYIPIYTCWSFYERRFRKYWDVYVEKMLPIAKQIVTKFKPDLIHVFGTEWPFAQIAAYTKSPVVIHIMGAIVPYNNANYPPGYSYRDQLYQSWWNPRKLINLLLLERNRRNREYWERKTWNLVDNYMGRTQWDESLSRIMHPWRHYFHVEEALRVDFISGKNVWGKHLDGKLRLISTGCSTFWKGPDMMLKVAKILTELGVSFEWNVAGCINSSMKEMVEKQVGVRFEDSNISFLGFTQPSELRKLLCSSTMYVHTAYIENSPNSICEAQCLGLPVVSTNVGGIASLVRQDVDGILVAANDPWQMADAIIELSKDKERMKRYSENGRSSAMARHNDEHIKEQLLYCYNYILSGKNS